MDTEGFVRVYDSQTEIYHDAFQIFLDHTDQKINAHRWLEQYIRTLPSRHVFIDAGAGEGQVTSWVAPQFAKTTAIEPNPYLCKKFRETCPEIALLAETITQATPPEPANLILCSHVFYYINRDDWMENLERLVSWLAPEGVVLVVLQNHQTDCMRMLQHFLGKRFDLSALGKTFQDQTGQQYQVNIETVQAHISTSDFSSAYTVAEFMLNLLPIHNPPTREAFENYITHHFQDQAGGYRFSCHQDFLKIQRTV